jgi:type VI secretion system protein ImpA
LDIEALTQPLSAERPCGESLEDTQLLSSFDAFRIFGQSTPLSGEIDWRAIRERALEALRQSKDFRPLTHLAAASLRADGLEQYLGLLGVAAGWLRDYWAAVFPLVDEDAILRRNALNGFADNMAVVDALRRVPLVANRQLGAFSLRQVEIAAGRMPAAEGEAPPSEEQIRAAFTAAPPEDLQKLDTTLAAGLAAIKDITDSMTGNGGGSQAAPDFAGLSATLAKMRLAVKPYLRAPDTAGTADEAAGGSGEVAAGVVAVGAIRSREDAVRALEAVAAYFRANEPSSPVPLFVERAKRLVALNFLEVLADLAPDALTEAKRVSGVKDE